MHERQTENYDFFQFFAYLKRKQKKKRIEKIIQCAMKADFKHKAQLMHTVLVNCLFFRSIISTGDKHKQ